jgi:ribosomal-protein-serine acetyltransferase
VSRPFLDLGDGAEVRWLEPSDAEELQALIDANRQRLRERMAWAEGSTVDSTRAFIAGDGSAENLDALGLVVDRRLVGSMGARPDRFRGDAEVGYWIDEAHEGRGLVTRACAALIEHLFTDLKCHRVTILAAPDNPRSRAIPERLGFTREGQMREAGWSSLGYHDLVVYGLLAHEWTPS